jgi:phospholipid/cholesterol/gamma-HCH transport system permease protein
MSAISTCNKTTWFPKTRQFLSWLLQGLFNAIAELGRLASFSCELVSLIVLCKVTFSRWMSQLSFAALSPLLLASVLCCFSGMVIALQVASEMAKQGGGTFVGALVALALVRELAPIMTSFAVIALVGSAYGAELANLTIRQQVDALRVMHVNPMAYLVAPRVIATTLAVPMLTVLTSIIGLIGGAWVSEVVASLPAAIYWDSVNTQLDMRDVQVCLLKSTVFGWLLGAIACRTGLNARGGSEAVGQASTQSVVWSFLAMAVADYILTNIFYGEF